MQVNRNASESETGATLRPSVLNPPAEASCTAFHYYLEMVCRPLRGLAPDDWIEDLRAELSCHLDALAEAYEELGESREEAVAHACRHLGDPEELARQWSSHWREKRHEPLRQTVEMAFRHFGIAAFFSFVVLLYSTNPYINSQVMGDVLRVWGVLIMPVHAGILFGKRSHGRRGPGAAAAIVLVAAVIALLGAILPGSDPSGLRPFLWQSALVYTLPIGTAAAAITGRLRDRKKRRARLAG